LARMLAVRGVVSLSECGVTSRTEVGVCAIRGSCRESVWLREIAIWYPPAFYRLWKAWFAILGARRIGSHFSKWFDMQLQTAPDVSCLLIPAVGVLSAACCLSPRLGASNTRWFHVLRLAWRCFGMRGVPCENPVRPTASTRLRQLRSLELAARVRHLCHPRRILWKAKARYCLSKKLVGRIFGVMFRARLENLR